MRSVLTKVVLESAGLTRALPTQVQHAIAEIKKALIEGATMALEVRRPLSFSVPKFIALKRVLYCRRSNVNKPLGAVAQQSVATRSSRYLHSLKDRLLLVLCECRYVEPHCLPRDKFGAASFRSASVRFLLFFIALPVMCYTL